MQQAKVMRQTIKHIPFFSKFVHNFMFPGSQKYWELRYKKGQTSGAGSYGKLAEFKAGVLNTFVQQHAVNSVIEFGCGDGAQLALANYPNYVGLDVAETAIKMCKERFSHATNKQFLLYEPSKFSLTDSRFNAELALSLDVIYHLVEDKIFNLYMYHLFSSAHRFVIIYSSDYEGASPASHIKHHNFSKWVKQNMLEWQLCETVKNIYQMKEGDYNSTFADFFIYEKVS